jgi:hypothetical protein
MLLLFFTSPVFGQFIETEDLMEPRFGNLPKLEIKYEVFQLRILIQNFF